ncbi:TetR/AcrR family transcriptional regulator [Ammoniphilus resinae]|uniref:AcrR family transcriptional regulator n=1 Tax=Ammoniphilus resinae TaxID=861532 RepID=A0ABS4GIV4_9BACL|nr:TetR/AcrR family transcriptional regulator [Ammoniphilus resinae]MBP1930193.1 AcrR family transcriptional regulator [Ammoniphilus resinae]
MARPGRRMGAVGEKSRELIITAATREFSQHGYHKAKISSIVSKVGLTQPSFYLYFESKEAIFKELENLFQSRLQDLTKKSRLGVGIHFNELSTRIRESLKNIFEFFLENKDLTRIGLFISPESKQIKEKFTIQITENLLAEQSAGYFRSNVDMAFVAESLVGVIMQITESLLLSGQKDPENLAAQIVDLFLYGLSSSSEK